MFEPVSDRKPGERGSLFDVDEDVGTLPEGAGRDDLVIVDDVRPANQPTRRERRAVPHEARGSLLDPAAIVDSLWRWKFLIAATSVAGAVVGVMIALATPHDYGATARLYIDPRDIRSSDTDSSSSQLLPTDAMLAVVDSQVEILSSNNVLQTVVDDLGLVSDPEMNGSVRPAGLGALIAPLTRLTARACRQRIHHVTRHTGGVLAGEVRQHRHQRRVVLQVVLHNLDAVQPVLDVVVVQNNPRLVPFADRPKPFFLRRIQGVERRG